MKATRAVAARQKLWFANTLNWYDSISNSTADSSDIWMQNVSMISHHGRSEICLQARARKGTLSWSGVYWDKIWWKAPVRIFLINASSASILCSCLGKLKGLILRDMRILLIVSTVTLSELTYNEAFRDNINLDQFLKWLVKSFQRGQFLLFFCVQSFIEESFLKLVHSPDWYKEDIRNTWILVLIFSSL